MKAGVLTASKRWRYFCLDPETIVLNGVTWVAPKINGRKLKWVYWGEISSLQIMALQVMKWPYRFVSSAGYFFTEWFWVPESPTYETVFFFGWPTFVWWSEATSLWQKKRGASVSTAAEVQGLWYSHASYPQGRWFGKISPRVMVGLIPGCPIGG